MFSQLNEREKKMKKKKVDHNDQWERYEINWLNVSYPGIYGDSKQILGLQIEKRKNKIKYDYLKRIENG